MKWGFFLMLLTSCVPHALPPFDPAAAKGKDVVIFVHGYYGSSLREKNDGTLRFIRLSTVLFGSFRIALDSELLGLPKSPPLEVAGLQESFPIIPWIYSLDIYGGFLEKLGRTHQVAAFAYDWRQDLFRSVQELDAFVKEVQAAQPRSISIAAHSMGGLIAAYYLGYGAQEPEHARPPKEPGPVNKVVFFGTPFRGTISILRNMKYGTGYPWNRDLLEPETVASFPSSYHLLPFASASLLDEAGNSRPLPLDDVGFWEKEKIGLLREPNPARRAYTQRQIERAVFFLHRLSGAQPRGLRVMNVVGVGHDTLATGFAEGFAFTPEGPAITKDGDGSVVMASAAPPLGFDPEKTVETDFTHDKLFLDPKVEKAYVQFLNQ